MTRPQIPTRRRIADGTFDPRSRQRPLSSFRDGACPYGRPQSSGCAGILHPEEASESKTPAGADYFRFAGLRFAAVFFAVVFFAADFVFDFTAFFAMLPS
jgi:hypothetical protein